MKQQHFGFILLAISMLLILLTVSGYENYTEPINSVISCNDLEYNETETHQELLFNITDQAIYKTAYYSINGANWTPINLTAQETLNEYWLRDNASTIISLPIETFSFTQEQNKTENYVAVYSCTAIDTNADEIYDEWDCHGDQWQLHVFNATDKTIYEITERGPIHTNITFFYDEEAEYGKEVIFDGVNDAFDWCGVEIENNTQLLFSFNRTITIDTIEMSMYSNRGTGYEMIIIEVQEGETWNRVYEEVVAANSNFQHLILSQAYTGDKIIIYSMYTGDSCIYEIAFYNGEEEIVAGGGEVTIIDTHISCATDNECDDSDITTEDTCNEGTCLFTSLCDHNDIGNVCPTGCNFGNDNDCDECPDYSDCNDNNITTEDTCNSGSCEYTDLCIDGDSVCLTDYCTANEDTDCENGECIIANDCIPNSCQTNPSCSGTPTNCFYEDITTCSMNSDGCCPGNCDYINDTDCVEPNNELIIINHTTTNITKIPLSCITKVKEELIIAYEHTSHGSQIPSGMTALESYSSTYAWGDSTTLNTAELTFDDNAMQSYDGGSAPDLGYEVAGGSNWWSATRYYLDNHLNTNVIMWSWCNIAGHDIPEYLLEMVSLINEYGEGGTNLRAATTPVKFVFITGHTNGGGEDDSSDSQNKLIRQYLEDNTALVSGHYFFDFANIEEYDPDGNYFLDQGVEDGLQYDSGGHWADEYVARHLNSLHEQLISYIPNSSYEDTITEHQFLPYCAHSPESGQSRNSAFNCVLKGQAAWHMFARMVGWDGIEGHECS